MELNYYIADDPQAARELQTSLVQDLQSPDGELLSYLPDQLPFQRETVPGSEEFLVRREGETGTWPPWRGTGCWLCGTAGRWT